MQPNRRNHERLHRLTEGRHTPHLSAVNPVQAVWREVLARAGSFVAAKRLHWPPKALALRSEVVFLAHPHAPCGHDGVQRHNYPALRAAREATSGSILALTRHSTSIRSSCARSATAARAWLPTPPARLPHLDETPSPSPSPRLTRVTKDCRLRQRRRASRKARLESLFLVPYAFFASLFHSPHPSLAFFLQFLIISFRLTKKSKVE